ncbi:MAG: hypothetical protein KGI97_07255, partial [Alphaproteobacteria bacterium]|nr:hypothetical protein [Alphaproteobacteria bacterium]
MLRLFRYIAEAVAAIVGVVAILAFLLAWRLSEKPVTSDFLTPYIEGGVESIVPGSHVKIAHTLLTWDNADHAISLQADDMKVTDVRGGTIAVVPSMHASLSVVGLLFGQFMPKDLSIDHPQFRLERVANGAFVFGGVEMSGAMNAARQQQAESIRDALRNAFGHLSHATLMRRFAVTRAVFDVYDMATQKNWTVGVPEISITRTGLREKGGAIDYGALSGHIKVEVTQKNQVASLTVNYAYDPHEKEHLLSSSFSGVT